MRPILFTPKKLRMLLRLLPETFTTADLKVALKHLELVSYTQALDRLMDYGPGRKALVRLAGTQDTQKTKNGHRVGGRPMNVYEKTEAGKETS
jgi:hypothetical protein